MSFQEFATLYTHTEEKPLVFICCLWGWAGGLEGVEG